MSFTAAKIFNLMNKPFDAGSHFSDDDGLLEKSKACKRILTIDPNADE